MFFNKLVAIKARAIGTNNESNALELKQHKNYNSEKWHSYVSHTYNLKKQIWDLTIKGGIRRCAWDHNYNNIQIVT